MKSIASRACLVAVTLACAFPFSSHALTIGAAATVQETSVAPGLVVNINVTGFYSGGAYAGVYNLDIAQGGVTGSYNGFCIDPFHYSPSSPNSSYFVSTLNSVSDPLNTTPMLSAAQASLIGSLVDHYYSVGMGNQAAADLQVAIWETVGGASFSASGYDATWYNNFIAAAPGSSTDHLTVRSPGSQDYVLVNTTSVPDAGTTLGLLGVAVLALHSIRRKLAGACQA